MECIVLAVVAVVLCVLAFKYYVTDEKKRDKSHW